MSNKLFLSLTMSTALFIGACSINPATGDQQFTALMSPAQEKQVGAQEHAKVVESMGVYKDAELQTYVTGIGNELVKNTERSDVAYTFTVLDSPMVNAFALPGGYVYVTRGLLALANNEKELAGVIGHEIGHVTARHSAERFSQSVLASLGTAAISLALDSPDISQVAGLGSQLYMKSYSRGQEHEADILGIRYLYRAHYDPDGMASFLNSLDQSSKLEEQIDGVEGDGFSYFSTHPRTSDRVAQARAEAAQYPVANYKADSSYLSHIDGIVYGDSAEQGFAKGANFYHPQMDFTFSVPENFKVYNESSKVIAKPKGNDGTLIVFDGVGRKPGMDASTYVSSVWLNNEKGPRVEKMTVNGMGAATANFEARVGNTLMDIRVVAVEWSANQFFRFQIAIPKNVSDALLDGIKRTTYSLRPMTAQEKQTVKPDRLRIVTAKAGDTVKSLSANFPFNDYREERFKVINGMKPGEQVMVGFRYKVITDK